MPESSFTSWETHSLVSASGLMKSVEAKVSGIFNRLFGGLWSKVLRFPEPLPGKLGQRPTAWSFGTSSDLEMP